MIYEIINPSDRYTIDCPDLEIAAVVCLMLGEGAYAFQPEKEGEIDVPIMMLGGAFEWFQKHFNEDIGSVAKRVLKDRRIELADAFDSVVIGDRNLFLKLRPKNGDERLKFRETWQDNNRSSMSDIGGAAYRMAEKLRNGW